MTMLRFGFMKTIEEIYLTDRQLSFESFFLVPGHSRSASHTEIPPNGLIFLSCRTICFSPVRFSERPRTNLQKIG